MVKIVNLDGDITLYNSEEMAGHLQGALDTSQNKVLLDFADVTSIDSSGLGVLIKFQGKFKAVKGEFVIANLSEHLKRLFVATRYDSLFATFDSVGAGMEYLQKRR